MFGIDVDKDVVRRVRDKHFRPDPGANSPSWLSLLGQTTDSLFSIDLFRCESLILKSHRALVVLDQYSRRIIGTIRRESLNRVPSWNTHDLQRKLNNFMDFYNHHRCRPALNGDSPAIKAGNARITVVDIRSYRWKSHCRSLYHLPTAA